jgi:hypothetical protein
MCGGCCAPTWFAAATGLFMTRDRPNTMWLSFDNRDVNSHLLSNQSAAINDYNPGFEIRVGRRFGMNQALELTYWTLDTFENSDSVRSPTNNLNTTLTVSSITLGGTSLDTFFDSAREHRIERRNEIHNIELNLLNLPTTSYGRLSVSWLCGARFFRFDEGLQYSSVQGGSEFGSNNGLNEAYYDVDVENNLIGAQVGAQADWRFFDRFTLYAAPRVGLYGNDINHRSQVRRGDGLEAFTINSNEADIATLAQLDLGMSAQLTQHWNAFMGYRLVSGSGIALADNQLPSNLADQGGIQEIDSNGHLLLHGFTGGVQLVW